MRVATKGLKLDDVLLSQCSITALSLQKATWSNFITLLIDKVKRASITAAVSSSLGIDHFFTGATNAFAVTNRKEKLFSLVGYLSQITAPYACSPASQNP